MLDLQMFVAPGFQKLCKEHVSFPHWMFGETIKAQINDTAKFNKMVESANKSLAPNGSSGFHKLRKSFLGKKLSKRGGHGRGGFRG